MQLEQVQRNLEPIEAGELALDSDYNEECSEAEDWEEAFVFFDPRGLLRQLKQACELVSRFTMAGLYQEAAALTERLLNLEVTVGSEAEEYDLAPFSLENLREMELLPEGILVQLLDGLYALYRLEPCEEQARRLWEALCFKMNHVMLKDILRGREEDSLTTRRRFCPSGWNSSAAKQERGRRSC